MKFDAHKNFAYSTIATAPSPATTGTSSGVQTGDGVNFPVAPFNATVWPAGVDATKANSEIVRVTAIATDTLTIVRAQEGSSARSIVIGDQIAATITAKILTDIERFSGSRVTNSATVSIPDGTASFTPITFDTETYDTDAYHSVASNTSRFTAPFAGYYAFGGSFSYALNSTGARFIMLRLNGTDTIAIMSIPAVAGFETPLTISAELNLSANDYVEILGYQNSGGALNISITNYKPNFWINYQGS